MPSLKSLVVALLATAASCTPVLDLSARAGALEGRDNCTEYASNSVGSVCVHLPSDCQATYIVQAGDTCQSIGDLFGNFTLHWFEYWNPDITQTCLALRAHVPVCIDVPWYDFSPPQYDAPGTVVDASTVPVPVMPGIISTCSKYEYIGSGQTIGSILTQNDITLEEFEEWNGEQDSTNPGGWADYYCCVGVSE